MKTRLGLTVLVVSMGLLAGTVGAGLMSINVELAPGETGQLSAADSNVMLLFYAYMGGGNGAYNDDGVFGTIYGSLKSSTGGLHGDLIVLSLAPAVNVSPAVVGTPTDLDADGDLDVGSNGTGASAAGFITPYSGNPQTQFAPCTDGNRLLIGTALFTVTDPAPDGKATTIAWTWRNRTGSIGTSLQAFKVDGNGLTLGGSSPLLAAGPGATVAFLIPEPVTMVMLVGGGLALLAARKRRKAA